MRVIGNLKTFNHKRSINAQVIRKVSDFNEIQYHMLEAIYVHLYHTRGPPPVSEQSTRQCTPSLSQASRSLAMVLVPLQCRASQDRNRRHSSVQGKMHMPMCE